MRTKGIFMLLLLQLFCLVGCRVEKLSDEGRQSLAYEVVKVADMPAKVRKAVQAHQSTPFFLTYEREGSLYIMQGFGRQKTGGCRIEIQEVSKSDEAVFVKAELIGPATREEQKGEISCPYMVLKTKACGIPVFFESC